MSNNNTYCRYYPDLTTGSLAGGTKKLVTIKPKARKKAAKKK